MEELMSNKELARYFTAIAVMLGYDAITRKKVYGSVVSSEQNIAELYSRENSLRSLQIPKVGKRSKEILEAILINGPDATIRMVQAREILVGEDMGRKKRWDMRTDHRGRTYLLRKGGKESR